MAAALGMVFVFSSCNPTKNLKEGQYFFTGYKIKVDNKSIDKEALHTYIRQKPNRKFFFLFRLQMGFYRLGENWNSQWLKKIGEEPVVLDTGLVHRSTNQLRFYMERKGYFNSIVTDTIIFKKKKAKVIYAIKSGNPYTIRKVEFASSDTSVFPLLVQEQKRSLIHPGMIYDEDILDKERERFTDVMKSQGYYFFTRQYVNYSADSSFQSYEMDLKVNVSRLKEDSAGDGDDGENHHQYYINKIYIRTDYDPKLIEVPPYDTVVYKNYYFLVNKNLPEQRYRRDVLLRAIFISTGDLFNINEVKYSYSRLTDLNVFRFVNIKFDEVPRNEFQNAYLLDVNILLTPLKNQDFTIETEGTHNAGNLGVAGQLVYRNKNTFNGAELLELKLKGGLEFQRTFSEQQNRTLLLFNTYEIGPEASLDLKRLLGIDPPLRRFTRKWNPRTRISIAANYQERPDYNRSIGNMNFSWKFKTTLPHQFSFDVFDVNFVRVQLSPSFINKLNDINDKGLFYSYSDHLITAGKFNWIYNNQGQSSSKNYDFVQAYFEASGLIFSAIKSASYITEDSLGFRKAFGLNYSQYFKFEIDGRHYQNFAANNILVLRADVGVGWPRKNSIALPFEKSFFAGGSNSLRAWRFRSLGPGSYINTFDIEQTGDIKTELNAEVRSPFSRRLGGITLEGAAFVDAGNIWLRNPDIERIGGEFAGKSARELLSEFAIGGGLGIRFNFTYFIFRIDAAVKLRDPSLPEAERWVYFRSNPQRFAARDVTYNFGIGYPF
jgi:outer membrane protein assembly factor BamA